MLLFIVLIFWLGIYLTYNRLINYKKAKIVFFLIASILVLFESIRWYSGVDFEMYYNSFIYNAKEGDRFEIIYKLLEINIRKITSNYTVFLFLISIIVYAIYVYIFQKLFILPLLSLYLLFIYNIGLLGSNRQVLATSICFLSFYILSLEQLKFRKIIFILLVTIASGFHITSLVFFAVVFLNRNFNLKIFVFLILFSILINIGEFHLIIINGIKLYLPEIIQNQLNLYLKIQYKPSLIDFSLGLLRRIFPLLLLIYYKDIFLKKTMFFYVKNILLLSTIVYILCYFNFSFITSRFTYFLYFEIFVYTWLLEEFYKTNHKSKNYVLFLLLLFTVLIFFKNIYQYSELFIPYKTIFY